METRSNRLWRSLSFWSGLLVMAAVLIGWWDSRVNFRELRSGRATVGSGGHGCVFRWFHDRSTGIEATSTRIDLPGELAPSSPWPALWFVQADGTDATTERELAGVFDEEGNVGRMDFRTSLAFSLLLFGRPGEWLVYLPYWLIALVVAAVWAGGMAWRWRRMRKASPVMEGGEG